MNEQPPRSFDQEAMRQREKELLDAAGLNEADTEIIRDLRACGFSSFVHGSLVRSELRDVSDIDFALIGDFSKIPHAMREELIPEISDEQLNSIDYFSVERISMVGRRMSLHIEKSEFREQYPNSQRPYAREYRPLKNVKTSGTNRYLLGGFNEKNASRVFSTTCPQEKLSHGVINTIPQTGIFLFGQEAMAVEVDRDVSIPITRIASELGLQEVSMDPEIGERIFVLGLEFDKMRTDHSLYEGGTENLIALPVQRTITMADKFLGKDSRRHIDESFALLGKYWYLRKEAR